MAARLPTMGDPCPAAARHRCPHEAAQQASRPAPRRARRAPRQGCAARSRGRRLPRRAHAPQPQGPLVAPAGGGEHPERRRPDLADLSGRPAGASPPRGAHAGRRSGEHRGSRARCRDGGEARHSRDRPLPLCREAAPRSFRQRGPARREPDVPRRARHQEGGPGDRRHHRRGSRPLHQPWSRRPDERQRRHRQRRDA